MSGEISVRSSTNGRPTNREDITTSTTEVAIPVSRCSQAPLFAGLQQHWLDGDDPETGAAFTVAAGAGLGSKFITITVEHPDHPIVYEVVDITDLVNLRVGAILDELSGQEAPT